MNKTINEAAFGLPPLCYEQILDQHDNCSEYGAAAVRSILRAEGYKDLGWTNDGAEIPKGLTCQKAYSNYSGSTTLMIAPQVRFMYWVDMGD